MDRTWWTPILSGVAGLVIAVFMWVYHTGVVDNRLDNLEDKQAEQSLQINALNTSHSSLITEMAGMRIEMEYIRRDLDKIVVILENGDK